MIKNNSSIALCMKYKILFALVVIGPLLMMGCKASKPADTGELSSASKSVVTTDSVQDAANGVAQEADETEGLPASDAAGDTSQNQTGAQSSEVDALEASPLRDSFKECSDASAGVTSAMQDCIAEEYEYQDLRLNKVYTQLKKGLPKQKMDELKIEQRKWLAGRDAKCAWDEKTEGQAQRLQANYCAMEETAKRAAVLEGMSSVPVGSTLNSKQADSVANSMLCAADESVLFACKIENKDRLVSLCASKDASENTGKIYYVYGSVRSVELKFPESNTSHFGLFKQTHLSFAGNTGGYAYSFENQSGKHILYSISGERGLEKQGLLVLSRGQDKHLEAMKCLPSSVVLTDDIKLISMTRKWKQDEAILKDGLPSVQ